MDRRTGKGWVAKTTDHDYADALSRGIGVSLCHMENTGALAPSFQALLRTLGKQAKATGVHDSTQYGLSPASPQSFYTHHLAAISAAVVYADVQTVLTAAAQMSLALSMGVVA